MRIVLLAVEPSADLHAAALVKSLKNQRDDIHFEGMGGSKMKAEGVSVWEDVTSSSEMGVTSFSSLRRWAKRIKDTRQRLLDNPPDAVISVDSPDFNLRVVKGLRGLMKTIEYVAPQAWAWREKRKEIVGQLYDHLMVIWPFEKDFFAGFGAEVTWVGVPSLDHLQEDLSKQTVAELPLGARVVAMLPGSRPREIQLNMDLFVDTAKELLKEFSNLYFLIPRVPSLDKALFKRAEELGDHVVIQEGGALACMNRSEMAMAVNGTVTIEAMFLCVPHVMTYGATRLQQMIYKPLMKTKYFNMANILKQKEIVPELLLKRRTVNNMVKECKALLEGPAAEKQKQAFKEIRHELGGPGVSDRAAKVVLEVLDG